MPILKHKFQNWSHTIEFTPDRFERPQTVHEVVNIVKAAADAGKTVRPQGAGHSFSQIITTRDTLLKLDRLQLPQGVDMIVQGQRVTVPAGMALKDIIAKLKAKGLGLRNIGSITEQSIAGVISTGTHGTGLGYPCISMQVVGMKFVDGLGNVRTLTEQDVDWLNAARISVGALGIITEVTLDCVPYYQVQYEAYLCKFDHAVSIIDQLANSNERVLVWWLVPPIGPRDKVLIVTKNPKGTAGVVPGAKSDLASLLGDALSGPILRQDASELQNLTMAMGALIGGDCRRMLRRTGDYEKLLTIPLLPVFHRECEYAIPAANAATAMTRMRAFFDEGDVSLRLPVEFRFMAEDPIHISPGRFGKTCYIGASTLENATEVYERFEPMMKDLGGRPHWGKHFNMTRSEVDRLYGPHVAKFRTIRKESDPNGVFLNSLLRELF